VRLRLVLDAVLHSGGENVHVQFHDISQQGACIECEKWLMVHELVRLDTGVMEPLYAKVRWRNHPRYGLVFEQTFKLDELARISAPLQLGQALTEAARQAARQAGRPGKGSPVDRRRGIAPRAKPLDPGKNRLTLTVPYPFSCIPIPSARPLGRGHVMVNGMGTSGMKAVNTMSTWRSSAPGRPA
jgi:hypothetical protein